MSLTPTILLSSLKDFTKCDDLLAEKVKSIVLEPFQSKSDNRSSPPLSAQELKSKASQLTPLALRIINQNIESLKLFMEWKRTHEGNHNIIKHCLIDTSFDALVALTLMKPYSNLKPLDIEKITSNLICKLVDIGEWARALEELLKFQQQLGTVAKIQLEKTINLDISTTSITDNQQVDSNIKNKEQGSKIISPGSPHINNKNVLTESPNQQRSESTLYGNLNSNRPNSPDLILVGGRTAPIPTRDENMIQKYAGLFTFPFDSSVNDKTMILLVLAYQMNAIRCWCDIYEGSLIKYIAVLLDRSGNFIDWCKHLLKYDEILAKKQFNLLQRHLFRMANKCSPSDDPLEAISLQILALRSSAYTDSVPLRSLCDKFVRLSISYEKSASQVKYDHLQKYCSDLLQNLHPVTQDIDELEAYFVFCEYYAYVSRKAKCDSGAIYAYNSMIQLLETISNTKNTLPYYLQTYYIHAKLSLCSLQMDNMVINESYIDISNNLTDIVKNIRQLSQIIQTNDIANDNYQGQALTKLYKSLQNFQHSSNRLCELIQAKKENPESPSFSDSQLMTKYHNFIPTPLANALLHCGELIPLNLRLSKKKGWVNRNTKVTNYKEMIQTFVDIMILVAKLQFDVKNENTYFQVYDYLANAEQFCSDNGCPSGFRWISATYYTFGAAMVTVNIISHAVYPLRKACTLLEKDIDRCSSDSGKLQLARRYEVLGTCCQRDGDFEGAIKAFRMALKRIPYSTIISFTSASDKMAVSTLIEQKPLVPKLIDRFLKCSIGDNEQKSFATEHMDLSGVSATQKCILYECEVQILLTLSSRLNLAKQQNFLIHTLLQHYSESQYPIRRARVLLNKIRMIYSNGFTGSDTVRTAISYATEVQKLMKTQDYGNDSNLLNYRRHYLALSFSWIGLLRRQINELSPKNFANALYNWKSILKKVNYMPSSNPTAKEELEQVYFRIDDIDRLYDHLRTLVDLFSLMGHPTLQINALRLLLKLNNGLRESTVDHISDTIIITTNIGRIFSELGYNGKAVLEFSKAKKLIQNNTCSSQAELYYMVQYSNYLALLGDTEKSKTIINTVRTSGEKGVLGDFADGSIRSLKKNVLNYFILSDCYLTRSLLSLHSESLNDAINDCISCYNILSGYLRSIKKSTTKYNPNENIFLVSSNSQNKPDSLSENLELLESNLTFREYQWSIALKLCACLSRLGYLHMLRGTCKDALYYLKLGQKLSEKVKSNSLLFQFYIQLSNSFLRTGQMDDCKVYLQYACEIRPMGACYTREDAELKLTIGDIDASQNYLDEAIQSYNTVDELLKKMMEPNYIISVENLVETDAEQERQLLLSQDAQSSKNEIKENVQFECIPIQAKQGEAAIYKSIIMVQKGLFDKSLSILEKFEDSGVMSMKEDLLNATIAHIRLLMVKEELDRHSETTRTSNKVSILPSLRLQRGQVMKHSNLNHGLRVARDNLSHSLERLLETHRSCSKIGNIKLLQRICNEIGYGMFYKNQFSNSGGILVSNYAGISAYYVEMSKGISLRREMQTCLDQKLGITLLSSTNKNTFAWPKLIINQEEYELKNNNQNVETPSMLMSLQTKNHLLNLRELYHQEHDLDDTEFQNCFIDILPKNWTVCSLKLDPDTQTLYICQYRSKETPYIIRLSLNRKKQQSSSSNESAFITVEQAQNELSDIIKLSDESIHNNINNNNNKKELSKKAIEEWWTTRSQLDNRLKALLEQIENTWFGGFKGILSCRYKQCDKSFKVFQQSIKTIFSNALFGGTNVTINKNKRILDISDRVLQMILRLGLNPSNNEINDIIYFIIDSYENQDITTTNITTDHSYSQAKIEKIRYQLHQAIQIYHDESLLAGTNTMEPLPNEHMILIPDQYTQAFPLESIPILRNQAVSRLPCMSFLRDRIIYGQYLKQKSNNYSSDTMDEVQNDTMDYDQDDDEDDWTDIKIDSSKAYYILNPSGDLKYTQSAFEELFNSMHTWEGKIQEKPSELECRSVLKQKHLYMYFGHSAGQSLIRGQLIKQLPSCPVTLLMGCSSGTLQSQGEYDPHGYVLNYLLGGSPSVVANLWDVTDKSIDKITKNMMDRWGVFNNKNNDTEISIVEALTKSRNDCPLPYLIGAATVVYGVPVYL